MTSGSPTADYPLDYSKCTCTVSKEGPETVRVRGPCIRIEIRFAFDSLIAFVSAQVLTVSGRQKSRFGLEHDMAIICHEKKETLN